MTTSSAVTACMRTSTAGNRPESGSSHPGAPGGLRQRRIGDNKRTSRTTGLGRLHTGRNSRREIAANTSKAHRKTKTSPLRE